MYMGLSLGFVACSTDLYFCFLCQYHAVLITVALHYSLKSGSVMHLTLFLFLRIALAIWGLLWFHINLRIIFFYCKKNAIGIFMGIAVNLQIALGSVCILTILILLIHEHALFFHLFMSSLISFSKILLFLFYNFHLVG